MKLSRRTALTGTAAAMLGLGGASTVGATGATASEEDDVLERHTTPDGVEFGLFGRAWDHPVPIMLVLTATIDQALGIPYYRQAGRYLTGPPATVRLVSIDLPCHGTQRRPDEPEGLAGWAHRAVNRDDFTAEFNQRMRSVVDHLIAEGVADPTKIVASGTSRGGFCAIRYAAHDSRVACAVGYAPVTDLRALGVFRIAEDVPEVDQWSLEAHTGPLAGRPVYVVIGDRDPVVSTDAAIRFARKLSNQNPAAASNVALHVFSEPRGHTMPPDGAELSALWINRVIHPLSKMFVSENLQVFRRIVEG